MAEEESMATDIVQIDPDDEVPQSEVQRPLAMKPKLLEAARFGNKRILDELLRPKGASSRVSSEEISIPVEEGAATQEDTSCLLGVTVGGNTALHIVASQGHLELAKEICQRERSLLAAQNKRLDTPLHCAARAGDDEMVSLLIQFAKEDGIEAERSVLRATNQDKANALHEAAKYGHVRVAEVLMEEDARLACVQNSAGMSPLNLAIVMGSLDVAKALLQPSSEELLASQEFYAGPDQETALHAVVLASREITEDILKRKPMLAKCVDSSRRIPLHYAALYGCRSIVKLLLKYDPSTAYLSDANGSFPIHMAASMGRVGIVDQILQQCPDTDELLDKEGGNFLHAAFQRKELDVVKKILSQRPYLRKLLNDQDGKGNTPLHMAVKNADQWSVYFLMRDKSVCLNIMNRDGLTPRDLAYECLDEHLNHESNAKNCIYRCLASTARFNHRVKQAKENIKDHTELMNYFGIASTARFSHQALDDARRVNSSKEQAEETIKDHTELMNNFLIASTDRISHRALDDARQVNSSKEQAKVNIKDHTDLMNNFGIASVLIVTVTFAAGFTPPGGYTNSGTPVLAKEYAFKVFIISDAFALFCSSLATCSFALYGSLAVDNRNRVRASSIAWTCLMLAMVGVYAAFGMTIYVALASTCKIISIFLCFIALASPFLIAAVLFDNYFSLVRAIGARQEHENRIRRLLFSLVRGGTLTLAMLEILGIYALFFLIAMIKS